MHFFLAQEPACDRSKYKGKGIWNWHSQRQVGALQSQEVQYWTELIDEKWQEVLCKEVKWIINIALIT